MTSNDREYEEKRDFIRMFVDATVEVEDPDTGSVHHGDSENLSAGGVAFKTDRSFDLNKKLTVKVSSIQSKLPPLTADFIVCRSDKLEENLYYVAGSIENVR